MGAGISGEVYLAYNIKTLSQFAVKKIFMLTLNNGIDKEAINRLKVRLNFENNIYIIERDNNIQIIRQ